MQMIPFVKMEGAGNDFVVLDLTKASFGLADGLLTSIADRRRGVGADQVLVLEQTRSDDADFRYRIFNGDGQEVEQCGNGARCIARFVRVKKNFRARRIRFETLKGVISVSEDENGWMTVDLGRPCFGAPSIPFCPSFWPEADEPSNVFRSKRLRIYCSIILPFPRASTWGLSNDAPLKRLASAFLSAVRVRRLPAGPELARRLPWDGDSAFLTNASALKRAAARSPVGRAKTGACCSRDRLNSSPKGASTGTLRTYDRSDFEEI